MENYRNIIDTALQSFITKQGNYDMYKHMEYFLGFRDESLASMQTETGKRFRPLLTLLFAEDFGGHQAALPAAISIELFHNFSLIHDDIVDEDKLRRGRKTVWQAFGLNHAINSGDAQLLLATRALIETSDTPPETTLKVQRYLLEQYQLVAEGQFLDFSLAERPLSDAFVTEETYQTMVEKKTAVLIGAAIAVAGIAHDRSNEEIALLYEYGLALGRGYQMHDDFASLWSEEVATGKQALGDLVQKKKNLPVLYAYTQVTTEQQTKLQALFDTASPETAKDILSMIDKTGAKEYVEEKVAMQKNQLETLRAKLPISSETDAYLQKLESRLLST